MNKSLMIGLAAAVFCVSVVACDRLNAKPQKWEYQVLSGVSAKDEETQLKKLGEEGWELVTATTTETSGGVTNEWDCYLKRPSAE
jgi:hypothetical protein